MKDDIKRLEERLVDLGRVMRQADAGPSEDVIVCTQAAAAAALVPGCLPRTALLRRHWMLRIAGIIVATLPIPLLFMWFDLRAASALFEWIFSPQAAAIAASIYAWAKISLFAAIYMVLPPALIWFGLKVRVEQPVMRGALQGVTT